MNNLIVPTNAKPGSGVIICHNCKRAFFNGIPFGYKSLPDLDVKDYGLECPSCKYFQHSFYLNAELEAMQQPDADRKTRRLYERKFIRLQQRIERKLRKVEPLGKTDHPN